MFCRSCWANLPDGTERCPKCQHEGSLLVVKSLTIMTLTCAACRHTWATELKSLPPDVQAHIPDALRLLH